ncbi:hypothetical protein [Streptomyces wuyuanensis]|uniref:hypothetical protein n=1 Tax=Streptomyces wuyuanensis TaxID=1196353 RepID=UPI00341EEC80
MKRKVLVKSQPHDASGEKLSEDDLQWRDEARTRYAQARKAFNGKANSSKIHSANHRRIDGLDCVSRQCGRRELLTFLGPHGAADRASFQ